MGRPSLQATNTMYCFAVPVPLRRQMNARDRPHNLERASPAPVLYAPFKALTDPVESCVGEETRRASSRPGVSKPSLQQPKKPPTSTMDAVPGTTPSGRPNGSNSVDANRIGVDIGQDHLRGTPGSNYRRYRARNRLFDGYSIYLVHRRTTLASIIVPAVMTSHLKPVLKFPVGITTNERQTTIPGQTPRHQFPLGPQTARFLIPRLAPQGLRYPRNVYGLSGQPTGMSRSHSENILGLRRKDVPMCSLHHLVSLQLQSPRRTRASLLLRTTTRHPAEDVSTPQEPPPDKSLSVHNGNRRTAELHLSPEAVVDRLPSIGPETSPSLKTTMHAESDTLPQDAKVAQSRLDSSPMLQRDSRLQKEVIRTILRFADVISIGDYGKTNLISPASTVEPGTTPIRMKQRPLNPVQKESLWQQVDQRFEQRAVEEVYSPWSFPLAPVLKKNSGEIRWAVHYRKQKDVSSPVFRREEAFPFPNIADHLSRLSVSKTSFALGGADASRLAARANRHLPPSERLSDRDDTALHPAGAWDQLRILRDVLSAFGAAGLQASPERAQLLQDHLKYLDCEVSAQRITGPPAYTTVIWEWPLLNTRKALHALLGKCEYYRGFMADYTTLLAPLVRYAQRKQHDRIPIMDKDFAALDAFRLLEEELRSASIHTSPRFHGKPFIHPDAMGDVLLQEPGGPERVTTCGARRLQPLEPAYASIRGELLAVMFFSPNPVLHCFLFVRTGNRALTWSRSRYSPTGRILRWLEILASFDFTLQLRKSTLQGNADSLSRVPHAALPSPVEEEILVSDEAAVVAVPQAPPGFTAEEIKEHQEKDDHLRDVQHGKTEPPFETEKQMLSPDQRRLLASMSPLHQGLSSGLWSLQGQEDGVPCYHLYVPPALQHWVMEAARQFLDHTGINSTSHFCRKGVFMFRLVPEVHRVLQHCYFCQEKSQKAPTPKDVHHPSIQAATSFQVWSMDVKGPVCASSEGHRYLRNWKDVFSKRFEAIPLSHTTSGKVLQALQMLYARFGYPLQVHTDNTKYSRSLTMQEAFQRAGVRLTFTPTYNPPSNPVERTHHDLNTMSHVLCHQHVADWKEVLPTALLALRSAVHESTGVTPSACLYEREPATPLDLVSKVPGTRLAANTYVRRLEDHQFCAPRAVQVQLARVLQRTSRKYGDEKDVIQPGEKVWLVMSRPSADRKLAIPYLGPCRVTKRLSGTLRTIRPEGYWCRQSKDITVSLNRVKRCYGENRAPQKVDHDLRRLEDAEDNAEGPTRNAWVADEGAASAQALDQEAGDVHAPSFREKSTSAAEPQPAPHLFSQYKDPEDMALPIVVHHERTSVVGPEQPGTIQHSAARIDSTTMTGPDPVAPTEPALSLSRTWSAPRMRFSGKKSAQVRPDSNQMMEPEVSVLPPALEELRDDIFMPSPSPRPSRAASTTATAPSTTDTVPSTTDTATDTDSGTEDRRGQKQAAPSLDTRYSQPPRSSPSWDSYPPVQRWIVTMLLSLKVLYDEHGFGPNLLWDLGPGHGVFPRRFYRRWRRFKQHLSQPEWTILATGGHLSQGSQSER